MITGILFIVFWLAAAAVWFVLSMSAGTMANDAGGASSELHARMLFLLAIGQILVAIAGILGGASYLFVGIGGTLWKTFWLLLAIGIAIQIIAVFRLFSAM